MARQHPPHSPRAAHLIALSGCLAALALAVGCSSNPGNGTRLTSNGQYFYVAPEHAGFSGPQMAAGDSVAWSLQRQGTFAAPGTAFAGAPVE